MKIPRFRFRRCGKYFEIVAGLRLAVRLGELTVLLCGATVLTQVEDPEYRKSIAFVSVPLLKDFLPLRPLAELR